MTANISSLYDRQLPHDSSPIEGESQELVDMLQKIVQNAGALLEVNNCSVALLDATRTTLVTLAALQKNGQRPRHTRFQLNEGVAGWVAEHRKPLIIPDVSHDPRFKRLGRIPIGSIACVPLIDKDVFIGTLTVSSPERVAFSSRKLQMLTIFAEQAVLAITNARQAELAQRQANQLEILLDISRSITTRLEADSLYRTILTNVRHLVPCKLAMIYRHDERKQELYPVAELLDEADCTRDGYTSSVGTYNNYISLRNPTSLAAWAAIHRHPMLHAPPHTAQDASQRFAPLAGMNGNHTNGAHVLSRDDLAEMATPLVSKSVLYGVLVLQRVEPFTSEELRLVRNLSNMSVAALENMELFHLVRTDREQLRAILTESSDGIALVGVNARFIEANPAFGRIFGIDPVHLVGMEFLELLGYDDTVEQDGLARAHTVELNKVTTALQQQQALSYIEVDLPIKGVSRSVGLSITPISATSTTGTTGSPLCLIIARDVTAIRDATRMKANFLSMITHELRSPLNAIHGYLDLTLTGIAGELNQQQREFVQRARASSEHLYALVEDLLLVSRADSGQLRLNREIIDLCEVIANAVEELELMAVDNELTIAVEVTDDCPPVYADAVRIQQVLRNLVSNALRFTPGGGKVTISASIIGKTQATETGEEGEEGEAPDEEYDMFEIQVRDTGCGIAPEYQQRIFDRFYQIPQTSAGRSSGQGLGLAIVKMIVELHGGHITVASTPGMGSTFSFTLPGLSA